MKNLDALLTEGPEKTVDELLNNLPIRDITSILDSSCHYITTKVGSAVRPFDPLGCG